MGLYLWLGLDTKKKVGWQNFIKLEEDDGVDTP